MNAKTEKDKMLDGELYDAGDPDLLARWQFARQLMRHYNTADTNDRTLLNSILDDLLGSRGQNVWITPPFFVDYGENIHFGNNCEVNMNCVFLDCNRITIGDNTTIGAGSVVTKSVPPNCLAVGNPCRVVRNL